MGSKLEELNTYRNMLRLNKHRLDDELEIQSEIQERISARVSILNSRLLEAADELRRLEAQLFADAKENGDSDKVAEQSVRRHAERQRAWIKWQAARSEHEQWQGLYEAWKARGYSMKELVALYGAQYFVVSPGHVGGRADRPRRVDYSAESKVEVVTSPERPRRRASTL